MLEDLWSRVTAVCAIFTISAFQHEGQSPLFPSRIFPTIDAKKAEGGPVFHPPGIPKKSDFVCEYPEMIDWDMCSTPYDRKCWLRNRYTGQQYDINTNYEDEMPTGITRYYNLTLEDSWFAADGLNFTEAKLFREEGDAHNQYPGPWIQACWGDTIIIRVTNKLKHNGTSVHWHGIRQNQTMHMDGVNGVTQCPIAPNDYFVYNFTATQYGSSWYHSHYSVQYADGAVGPMTLHGPTSTEFDEAISPPLIMTDWGHNSAFVAATSDLLHPDILLNGRGNVTNYNNKTASETEIKPPYTIVFDEPKKGRSNKKYLMRIINTSFDTTFIFSIDNHMLQVVSADFVPIQPYRNQSILIGIGQRYNVIVEANPLILPETGALDPEGNYWIRTQVAPCFRVQEGTYGYEKTGILRYNPSSAKLPTSQPWGNVPPGCRDEDYAKLVPILPWTVGPPVNQQTKSQEEKNEDLDLWSDFSGGGAKYYPLATWSFGDREKFSPLRVDYSDPTIFHFDNTGDWNPMWNIVPENYTNKDWVYLVIKGKDGHRGAHPIHLHGHDFALLEQAYNKTYDPRDLNLKLDNPPRRDVVLLPRDGYIVIAFKADNPGAWLVHCHIAKHIGAGLGLQILEDQWKANEIWPRKNNRAVEEAERVCNNWRVWQSDTSNWAVPPESPLCETKDRPDWCFQDDSGV